MTHEVISAYCKKHVGQTPDHDRCYGRSPWMSCKCKCHDGKDKDA